MDRSTLMMECIVLKFEVATDEVKSTTVSFGCIRHYMIYVMRMTSYIVEAKE
jgi:hypothetical protein